VDERGIVSTVDVVKAIALGARPFLSAGKALKGAPYVRIGQRNNS